MTELEFRNKVTWFSFALSLLVIWVHSYNAELFLGYQAATGTVYVLEHQIGDWFGQIAVPGFFMISGYQFYRDFDWGKLKGKWQRRVKSLLVPYIVWNFLYYLSYVIASRIPAVGDVVGKGVVEFSLAAMVDAVVPYTYNNVFWYLYQLLAGGAGAGALSALKAEMERPLTSGVFLDSGAGKSEQFPGESGRADLLWKRSHDCASLPGGGGRRGEWKASCSGTFESCGSSGYLLYRALAGPHPILCPVPIMRGSWTLAGASGKTSSGGKRFYEA